MTWRSSCAKQQILTACNGRRSRSGVRGVWISSVGPHADIRYCVKYVLTQFSFGTHHTPDDTPATLLPSLLPQYARAYHIYAHQLLPTLRTSASSFEISRTALARWIALSKVDGNGEGNGWFGDPLNRGWTWEEICAVEVEGWE